MKDLKILIDIIYDLSVDRPDIQDRLEKLAVKMNKGETYNEYIATRQVDDLE